MLKAAAIIVGIVAALWLAKVLVRLASSTPKHGAERDAVEEADWFGKTGLDPETERELPRYLRRELGESLGEPGCLRASDLRYLGIQTDARDSAHFWAMPERLGEGSFAYAQLATTGEVLCLGWGDWAPPG